MRGRLGHSEDGDTQDKEDGSVRLKGDGEDESKQSVEKKKVDEGEESLEENFDFLSKRGMIATDNVSKSSDTEQSQK